MKVKIYGPERDVKNIIVPSVMSSEREGIYEIRMTSSSDGLKTKSLSCAVIVDLVGVVEFDKIHLLELFNFSQQ